MEKIERALLTSGIVLLPLVFWPGILSPFETPKILIVAVFALLTLLVCSIKIAIRGSLNFKLSNFDLPVILLALVYIVSALIKTPNKLDAFFLPGTALIILLGALYFHLAGSLFSEHKKSLAASIFVSGILASVASLLFASGVFAKIPGIPAYLKNSVFSLLGGKLPEAIFLISVLPLGIALLAESRDLIKKIFWGISLAVVILSASLSIYNMLPGKLGAVSLPSFKTSWAVSVDALKDSPFLGIGAGNYITAFSRFRPVNVNSSDSWALTFTTSRSFLLTSLTETGIIGFIILAALLYQIYRFVKKSLNKKLLSSPFEAGVFASLALTVASFVFFPFYLTTVFLFFLILSIVSSKHEVNINLKTVNESKAAARLPAIVLSLVMIALISVVSFMGGKITLAEYNFAKALLAVNKNDGKLAYDTMIKAINLNPRSDKYHMSLSQMDIAFASAIAQNKDLTESDKNTITQLIQEGIAEAKNGVSLNPQRSGNWENLARIYQSIMPFAQGSDNFAIQTYTQAIALDPVNPNLRISLGGIYYALGRYDEAISAFQMATLAKPDLANAHYNLSAAYREKSDIDKAITEMNTVLTLVAKDSSDYNLAKAELESLQKKLPAAKTAEGTGESLTPPAEAPAQVIKPPLELPSEANPPATQ
ncbi:MAG: tetratricopeptide repeat protein [Candidatus Woesebacteria bacterium]|nr:tetratricopeptide repeat protein [Candidatus Woesebacteria bacterium]